MVFVEDESTSARMCKKKVHVTLQIHKASKMKTRQRDIIHTSAIFRNNALRTTWVVGIIVETEEVTSLLIREFVNSAKLSSPTRPATRARACGRVDANMHVVLLVLAPNLTPATLAIVLLSVQRRVAF
jgi:hypothetical protein